MLLLRSEPWSCTASYARMRVPVRRTSYRNAAARSRLRAIADSAGEKKVSVSRLACSGRDPLCGYTKGLTMCFDKALTWKIHATKLYIKVLNKKYYSSELG